MTEEKPAVDDVVLAPEIDTQATDTGTVRLSAYDFRRIIRAACRSVADHDPRPQLNCVHLTATERELKAWAADGYRASIATAIGDGRAHASGSLAPKPLRAVAKAAKRAGALSVSVTPGASWRFQLHLLHDVLGMAYEIPSADVADKLPDVTKLVPERGEPTVCVSPHLLREILKATTWRSRTMAEIQIAGPMKAVLITLHQPFGTIHSQHVLMPMTNDPEVWKRYNY